jgi:hypothetical protein
MQQNMKQNKIRIIGDTNKLRRRYNKSPINYNATGCTQPNLTSNVVRLYCRPLCYSINEVQDIYSGRNMRYVVVVPTFSGSPTLRLFTFILKSSS